MIHLRDLFKLTPLDQNTVDNLPLGNVEEGAMLFNATLQLPQIYTANGWVTLGSIDPQSTKVFSGLGGFYAGAVSGNTVIASQRFDVATLFKQHITSSTATCIGAPTDVVVFDIIKISSANVQTSIGTIVFASGNTVASFTFPSDILFDVGEQMRIISPNDTHTINRISFNILGESLLPLA